MAWARERWRKHIRYTEIPLRYFYGKQNHWVGLTNKISEMPILQPFWRSRQKATDDYCFAIWTPGMAGSDPDSGCGGSDYRSTLHSSLQNSTPGKTVLSLKYPVNLGAIFLRRWLSFRAWMALRAARVALNSPREWFSKSAFCTCFCNFHVREHQRNKFKFPFWIDRQR